MSDRPTAYVIRTDGTNCDQELVRAFSQAGARTRLVRLDQLISGEVELVSAELLGFAGGFSYGDDLASGRVFAARCRHWLTPALRSAAERGCLMIGVCNGFQVLLQAGLLPDPLATPDTPPPLALIDNANARYQNVWTRMRAEPSSVCVWTGDLHELDESDTFMYPSAHGEGRLVAASERDLDTLEANGQIALRYVENFNGSARAIAGVCDPSGRILGLMPHPERFLDWNRHPFWASLDLPDGPTPGELMFRAAVRHAREAASARV